MKKILLSSALVAVSVMAMDVNITTGKKGGSYHKSGYELGYLLKDSVETKATIMTSKGSTQNFKRLMNGKADIAFAQKDAYKSFIMENPEAKNSIEIIDDLYKECVYIVARTDGKIDSDSDLQKDGIKIAIGSNGSGGNVTWNYMTKLEKGFAKATAIPKSAKRSLGKVRAKQLDAVLYVAKPTLKNKLNKTIANSKDLKFVSITDWDLNDKLDGSPIYSFDEIDLKKGFFNDSELKTICTTASVFVRSDLDEEVIDGVADMMLKYRKTIAGE